MKVKSSPARSSATRTPLQDVENWFTSKAWTPLPFQRATWEAYGRGESGLLHVPTGAGKTYAAYFGPLMEIMGAAWQSGLQILYITPLRAVSRDIEKALILPVQELNLELRVESRTGDTSSYRRSKQKLQLPQILITTPESLSLLLTDLNAAQNFSKLKAVIVDEWHELLGSKRGTQTQLALTRLRKFAPTLKTWALSATLKNLEQAAAAALAPETKPTLVSAQITREIKIETLIPPQVERFPWAGHMGLTMLPSFLNWLNPEKSTLIFVNTRSQAERWYQEILFARPEWESVLALHHSSIDRKRREKVEAGLKSGEIRIAICTSSLDLGVDFAPVERVVQIGSPKGIARLTQRAGRSGHRPGEASSIFMVPTHAFELIEIAAVRESLDIGAIENRDAPIEPLDVLAQHLVTIAIGGGFDPDELYHEVTTAYAYRHLSREDFDWTLELVQNKTGTLKAYEQFKKISQQDGKYQVSGARISQLHRLNIGTIVSDSSIQVQFIRGGRLGSVEESYIARMKPGDNFFFAGRLLKFVRVKDMVAYVRLAKERTTETPRWDGGKLPLSADLCASMRNVLDESSRGIFNSPEIIAAKPVFEAQAKISKMPHSNELLIEICQAREGHFLFVYPFEGRLVHEGLASLLAFRMSQKLPMTFSLSVNDYGLQLLAPETYAYEEFLNPEIFSEKNLLQDLYDSMNLTELSRRQFREIARVSGLTFQNYRGGSARGAREVQASAGLLFDVFHEYDPKNLLLAQAEREVLERQFERSRLYESLLRMKSLQMKIVKTERLSPFAFPLVVEIWRARLSNESLMKRIERINSQ